MLCTYYQVSFASNINNLKEILYDITDRLKREISSISDDALFDLRVVFSELIVNAIIHGNKRSPNKKVLVTLLLDENTVQSIIKDEGDGFDYYRFLDSEPASYESLLSDRGRGLLLVNSLTDSLRFNDVGNEVEFIVNL